MPHIFVILIPEASKACVFSSLDTMWKGGGVRGVNVAAKLKILDRDALARQHVRQDTHTQVPENHFDLPAVVQLGNLLM